jgi:hypothetical protein
MTTRQRQCADVTHETAALAEALAGDVPPCRATPDLWFALDTAAAIDFCHDCPGMLACHQLAEAAAETYGVWRGIDRAAVKPREVAA